MKFVISDLDGTLLQPNHMLSEYTVNAIKKLVENNVDFVIATGRGKLGVQHILNQLKINVYLICNNGANIYDKEGKKIFEGIIPPAVSSDILKTIKENGLFYSAFRENIYYRDSDDKAEYPSRNLFTEKIIKDINNCPDLNKIIVTNDDPQVIIKINDILREKYDSLAEITISQATCMDIAPKGCTKGTALKHLAEIFNVTTDDFMAFGDGENDLEMLRTVGHPVIVANAQEIVKKEFSTMTGSNIDNGVAKYIEKYFNI